MALAGPLIPVIDRVRDKLIEFLGPDGRSSGAEQLGEPSPACSPTSNIDKGVGMLEGAIDTLSAATSRADRATSVASVRPSAGLPWESIGNAATLLGTGSKAMLDAFMGMPAVGADGGPHRLGPEQADRRRAGPLVGELGKGADQGRTRHERRGREHQRRDGQRSRWRPADRRRAGGGGLASVPPRACGRRWAPSAASQGRPPDVGADMWERLNGT